MSNEGVPFVLTEDDDTRKSGGSVLYSWVMGPKDTLYEGYAFKIRVYLPPEWPVRSPSIAFVTKVMHVNIEFQSGAICCNQINEDYAPATRLSTIIKIVLPQLLEHPNSDDPFNVDAAYLMKNRPQAYDASVREVVASRGIPLTSLESDVRDTRTEFEKS